MISVYLPIVMGGTSVGFYDPAPSLTNVLIWVAKS